MSDRLKGLREKRGKVVADMRKLVDAAEAEKRAMTDEDLAGHDKLFAESERLRKEITAEERQTELDREAATGAAADDARRRAAGTGEAGTEGERRMASFRSWLGGSAMSAESCRELRALQAGVDTEGGFILTPELFVQQLLKNVDDLLFVRQVANVIPLGAAKSLGVPSLDTDPDDADWTSELATGSEDSAMAFGRRELNPHPLAKRIKVSNKLLRAAALPIESIVRDRLAYKFALPQEKAFLTGTGAQQPLGVYTASADGISTGRDVSTGNTTTAITFDGLIEAKYTLKSQYWGMARWNFHRDAMKQISKLKDGEGQYLWRPSVRDGEPDRILGHPIDVSENTPNTFTTGLYVGLFGDWSKYWIADALDMQMQRLIELYAETNQTGFIGRLETDGMPVLEEAFIRVTLA